MTTLAGFYRTLWKGRQPGDRVKITVLRKNELRSLVLETGDRYAWLKLAPVQ